MISIIGIIMLCHFISIVTTICLNEPHENNALEWVLFNLGGLLSSSLILMFLLNGYK